MNPQFNFILSVFLVALFVVAVLLGTSAYNAFLKTAVSPVRYKEGTQIAKVATTGYASSPYQTDASPCIAAFGNVPGPGTIASNFLLPGTIVTIDHPFLRQILPKQAYFIVEDRMNRRYHQAIDIYFAHTHQALEWGRRPITVTVVGYGTPGGPLPDEKLATEEGETIAADSPTIIDRIKIAFRFLPAQLRTAVNPSYANRYDVDCGGKRKPRA